MSPLTEPTRLTLKQQSVAATDTNIREVSLLLHGNGTNGSTTITDSSLSPKTVTAVGNAQISTAQSKFGGSSLLLNNNFTDVFTVPTNAAFAFGTGDFTVEAWIFQLGQRQYSTLLEIGNHLYTDSIVFLTGTSGFQVYSGGFYGAGNYLSLNTWQHIAYCRSGPTLTMYVNGAAASAVSFPNNLTNVSTISIGFPKGYIPSGDSSGYPFNGYIDDLRITKGVARYTANFTPPTLAFPDF